MSAPSARFTVLLLHAFPLDAGMWDETRRELGEDVVTDAPTLPPAGGGRALSGWASAVLGLVEGDLVPIGVSMGGYLAFELWRQAPERISALVLSDTRAGPETDEGRAGRERTIQLIRERGAEGLWEEMEPKLFSPAADPDVVERARSIAFARDPEDLVACVEAIRDRPDSRPTLQTIDVATLVLVGEKDELTPPPEAAAIASGIGGREAGLDSGLRPSPAARAARSVPRERPRPARPGGCVTADELARRLEEGSVAILDVRTREEYEGSGGYPCDPRQGHIPGAVHLGWEDLFAGEGRPHDRATVLALLEGRGVDPELELVTYCHSGQRSSFAAAALRAAGLEVENYEGSWHEWSRRDPESEGVG